MNAMPRILVAAVSTLLLTGCGSTHPIREWQQHLTKYTMKQGNGDINVLRESAEMRSTQALRPAQIRFDHNDMPSSALAPFGDRVDAHGVLVGQHVQNRHPVFYFLVGIVKRPSSGGSAELKDIRLVSCAVRDGKHHWKVSEPNPAALRRYQSSSTADDGRAQRHATQRTFPLLDDDFQFEVSGSFAFARDAHSSATWQISVN